MAKGTQARRGHRGRDATVALVGGLVILLAFAGLLVVEERGGPYVYELSPAGLQVISSGSYETRGETGAPGPAGGCVPPLPETECAPAGTSVRLLLEGLPVLPSGAAYVGYLTGGGLEPVHLGALDRAGEGWLLEHEGEEDRRAYETLVVSAEAGEPRSAPRGPLVHRQTVGPLGGDAPEPVPLDSERTVRLGTGGGRVVLDQIGAVTVSATAEVSLAGVTGHPGWVLHAWMLDGSGRATSFGAVERDQSGQATLDGRVERVRLPEAERFVVTLRPEGMPPGEGPAGLPAYEALLRDG